MARRASVAARSAAGWSSPGNGLLSIRSELTSSGSARRWRCAPRVRPAPPATARSAADLPAWGCASLRTRCKRTCWQAPVRDGTPAASAGRNRGQTAHQTTNRYWPSRDVADSGHASWGSNPALQPPMSASPLADPHIQSQLQAEAMESAAVGFLVWDEDRRYIAANKAACEILGTSLDELLGQPVGGHTVDVEPLIEEALKKGYITGTAFVDRFDGSGRIEVFYAT